MSKKSIVLLSGGIDSTILLSLAAAQEEECLALSFDYGQRHRLELHSAKLIAQHYQMAHRIISLDSATFSKTALVDSCEEIKISKNRSLDQILTEGIPTTYVPARNTLFLAYAISQAELWQAQKIYFGCNAHDYDCYPDCRPEYVDAINTLMQVATKQAVCGSAPQLNAPLLYMKKGEIIQLGHKQKIPFHLTLSCYDPSSNGLHCGQCDACVLRRKGFQDSGLSDPTQYVGST